MEAYRLGRLLHDSGERGDKMIRALIWFACILLFSTGLSNAATDGIEILRGEHAGTLRVQGGSLRLKATGNVRQLGKAEINTFVEIIKALRVFKLPAGETEVKFPGFPEELTLIIDDSGRKVTLTIGISENCRLMSDELTLQTYVVPDQDKKRLKALLSARAKEKKPHP